MGKSKNSRLSVQEALFSPVQADLLCLLFGHPDERFHTAELIRRLGRGSGAVQRQLSALVDADLVTVTPVGNQKHYQANRHSPVFHDLHGLVVKTGEFVGTLRNALMTLSPHIAYAVVFGSVASGTARSDSDLDLLVVTRDSSALDHATLYEALMPAETTLNRRIEPILMQWSDWIEQRAIAGSFASRVASGPTVVVCEDPRDSVTA